MFQDEYGADVLLIWWFLLRHPLVVTEEPLVEYRTYPVKSADTTAESLNPAVKRRRWLMTGLWRSLWREAGAPGVDPLGPADGAQRAAEVPGPPPLAQARRLGLLPRRRRPGPASVGSAARGRDGRARRTRVLR